ncbi:CPBP family intramembrane glutamic endopeptidase [Streptomyces antibioticus]|uniref:CPBP family intramembrane glutamic endopeptidase n=1 Tax=Streptomyces antibioticus TaxID=1890 RepID=UPI0036D85D5D
MWSRTLSLEGLVLLTTVAPAELVRVVGSFRPGAATAESRARTATTGVLTAYLVVTVLALAVTVTGRFVPWRLGAWSTGPAWLAAAVGAGVALVAAEFAMAAVPKLLRGVRDLRFAVRSDTSRAPGHLASITVVAVAEEVLYRGLWIGVLEQAPHLAAWSAVCVAALAYALGHVFFGGMVMLQKALSGAVFGLLLVASGSLLVPVAAHLAQNLAVHALAVRQGARR